MNVETIEAARIQPSATLRPFRIRRLIPKAKASGTTEMTAPSEAWSGDSSEHPDEFPICALNSVMRQIVEETANTFEIVPQLPGMAALATLAGAAGKGWIGVGASNKGATWCNLMVVPAVPKSYGKGVTGIIAEPLIEASEEMTIAFQREQLPELEGERLDIEAEIKGLTDRLNPQRKILNKQSPLSELEKQEAYARRKEVKQRHGEIMKLLKSDPTYWIGGTSMAGMVEALARNREATFHYSAEAGEPIRIALGKHTKDQQADLDLLLSGYSVERVGNTTISRGDHRLTPCISVLWMVQPFLLRELIGNEEALERGLTARMLPFVFESTRIAEDDGQVREVSEAAKVGWRSLIRAILAARQKNTEPQQIVWDRDAREVFRQFHNESVRLRNGRWHDIEGELGRWRENAIRIGNGIVLADAFTGQGKVDIGTADQARRTVTIMRWCARSQLAIFSRARKQRSFVRLERLLTLIRQYGGRATLRDLGLRHGFHEEEVRSLVTDYSECLQIFEDKNRLGGRPSIIVAARTSLM